MRNAGGGAGQRVQRAREVAVELGGDRPRVLALGLGDVDHDELAVLAERLAEAEPEVHRDADHERDVGALQAGAARAREEERVVGRQAAAREPVEEDRYAERLGQRAQRRLAVAPVEVRAGHDHRPLGVAQQRRGAVEHAPVGRRGRMRDVLRGLGLLGLHEDVVEREVDERRAAVRAQRLPPGVVDQARDLGRRRRGRGELHQRPHERHVVDLLQRPLAPAHRGRAAAEHEHRRVVLLRGAERAHPVRHARARPSARTRPARA